MRPMTSKLLSLLLHYPDGQLLAHLAEILAAAQAEAEPEWGAAITAFTAAHLGQKALFDLQMDYTALFDLNPAVTLNLTNHLQLSPEGRADLLSRLQGEYLSAGLRCSQGELPDYLPLLFEYLWLHPAGWQAPALRETLAAAPPLIDRLESAHPAYAGLLQPLRGTLQRRNIVLSQEAPYDGG